MTRTIEISIISHENTDALEYNVTILFHAPALFERRGAWRRYENVSPASVSRLQNLTRAWRMLPRANYIYMTTTI